MNPISPVDKSGTDTARLTVAWKWVLRLRQDSVGQDDLAEWLGWYEADERNKDAFEEMQAFWRDLDRVADDPDPLSSTLWLGELETHEDSRRTGGEAAHPAASPNRRLSRHAGRHQRWVWATAATIAGLFALLTIPRWNVSPGPPTVPYVANAVKEGSSPFVKETVLPDGSRVELAPKSTVSLNYTGALRGLVMNQGVAYFTVAHNQNRPFVVTVANVDVRAVGTAFNIRSAGDRVVVTVVNGVVDVYSASASGASTRSGQPGLGAMRVKAGSEIVWSADGRDSPIVRAVDASQALAWRQGQLDFINEPLASAMVDINRYSKNPIIIRDAAVGKIVFSGTIRANEADTWIKALPALFPIDINKDASGNVILESRDSHKAEASPSRK